MILKLYLLLKNMKSQAIKGANAFTAKAAQRAVARDNLAALDSTLAELDTWGGWATTVNMSIQEALGSEDPNIIRLARVRQVIVDAILSRLPPGTATEKDVALAQSTAIAATANPILLRQERERLQIDAQKDVDKNEFYSDWVLNNNGVYFWC